MTTNTISARIAYAAANRNGWIKGGDLIDCGSAKPNELRRALAAAVRAGLIIRRSPDSLVFAGAHTITAALRRTYGR